MVFTLVLCRHGVRNVGNTRVVLYIVGTGLVFTNVIVRWRMFVLK